MNNKELLAGIAHEVRNSSNVLKGLAELLGQEIKGDEEAKELVSGIIREAQSLDNMIQRFSTLTQAFAPNFSYLRINRILDETLLSMKRELKNNRIELNKAYENNLPAIKGDAEQLKEVFLNLILNAFQAMSRGGKLTISTRMIPNKGHGLSQIKDTDEPESLSNAKRSVEIRISDTGKGIVKNDLGKLFKPFFTTKTDGIGLGLSIVQRIIKAHQGKVIVESEEEKGATFRVLLPCS